MSLVMDPRIGAVLAPMLADGQGAPVGVGGGVEVSQAAEHDPQVVEAAGHVGVVGTEPGLADGEGVLHTSCPEGGRSGSSGRSIRRSFRLVATSSTLPQGQPAGGRLRRPSSAGKTQLRISRNHLQQAWPLLQHLLPYRAPLQAAD